MCEKWIHGRKPGEGAEKWKDGIRLIINGGSDRLDTATVPIEWRFSDAVIAEEPQYIVICDHEISLEEFKEEEYHDCGRRYLVKVTDCARYIQLFKAGIHHLVFMVFCGEREKALEHAREYTKGGRLYQQNIWFRDVASGYNHCGRIVPIYIAHVEFEVPAGLLAERPQSGFWKYLCLWANLWFGNRPVDECAQRKRYILAPLALLLWLVWRIGFGIGMSLYTPIAWLLVGFLGWRPKSVFPSLKDAWINPSAVEAGMVEISKWRCWKKPDYGSVSRSYAHEKYLPIWAVPWVIALELGVPYALYRLYLIDPMVVKVGGALILLALLLVTFWVLIDRLVKPAVKNMSQNRASEKQERVSTRAELVHERYLKSLSLMSLDHAPIPDKVDIKAVMKKVDRPVQLRLRFWATKAKVCRPFSK